MQPLYVFNKNPCHLMFSNAHPLRFILITYISPCKLFEKLKTQLIHNNYVGNSVEIKRVPKLPNNEGSQNDKRQSRSR